MIPLHVHSFYSLMEGAASVEDIIEKAKSFSLPAVALTDTNGMYGLTEFSKKAAAAKIKPLPGAYIDDPSDKKINAVFIAKNTEGYADLCRIITSRKLLESMPPAEDNFSLIKLLQNDFPNLFIITSSPELLRNISLNENMKKNIFVELIAVKKYESAARNLYEFANSKKLPYIASNPVYFLNREDYILHQVLRTISERGTIENIPPGDPVDEEFYFKNPGELMQLWKNLPEAVSNTYYIAENCDVSLEIGKYKFPSFQSFNNFNDKDTFTTLWSLAFNGLFQRYSADNSEAIDRLNQELNVILNLELTDYFLVVWDILREAKKRGMMHIGRGSAANSIVSYCLGFTDIDPIEHNLFFERFLNRSRSSPPDIDIDFSWKERDEIIKYVFEKYGYDKVAMISTHVTFRARSAFREVAKVFGIPDAEITKKSKFIPWTDARNLPDVPELFPEAKSLKFNDEPWKTIVNIAAKLANFPRHLSIHPGGIVIAPKPITNYVALEYAKNKGVGLIITQPDMHGIEDLGLVKIDLLSQRSLGVLRDTIAGIRLNSY
ncbi:MAG: PHP domain-containing protein [Ignavibacteriaceae bacterium]